MMMTIISIIRTMVMMLTGWALQVILNGPEKREILL